MTDSPTPSEAVPDVTEVLQSLMPDLRRAQLYGWLMIAAVCGVACVGIYLVATTVEKRALQTIVIGLALAAGLIFMIATHTRRSHERAIMPILAKTVGLSYQKDASYYVKGLPARLLPDAHIKGEDYVHGTPGGRSIRMAEVTVETGGKNSRTLFKGIVANFRNSVAMPPFFIADEAETGTSFWFGNKLDVDDLVEIRFITGETGQTYGVWASSMAVADHPALAAVLGVLTNLEYRIGGGAQLYSATSNGEEMYVALTHKRDLYRVGGLLAPAEEIMDHVTAAYRDLTLPLTIADRLMEAEKSVGQVLPKG